MVPLSACSPTSVLNAMAPRDGGPESERPRSQPINFVSWQAPPMLLLAGQDDGTVDPINTLRLAARPRAFGVQVDDTLYPGVGNEALIASISQPLTSFAPARAAMLLFTAAHGTRGG
jgi:hypothetical protein